MSTPPPRAAKPSLWIVLPAYNEAANIARVVAGVRAQTFPGVTATVVVVDDGSRDDTARLATEAGAVVLRHERNRGVGAGFRTGLEAARAAGVDFLAHMDSDGQFHAEDLPRVVAPVVAGDCDLALGSRFVPGVPTPPNLARWKATALHLVARGVGLATGSHLTDLSCGIRCMNRRMIEQISPTFDYDYIQETLVQAVAARARICDVPVTPIYGEEGNTGMSGRTFRYGRRFLGLTAFSLWQFYRQRAKELLSAR